MADSIERIADEMDEAAVAYAGHHSSGTFRRLATRLRARSPAGGGITADWVVGYLPMYADADTRKAVRYAFAEYDALLAASPQQSPAGGDLHHAVWSMVRPYIQPAAREKVNAALKEMLAASPQQEPGAEGLRDAISASLYELSLVGEGREHDEAVAHIEKRITSGQTLAGAGGTLVSGSRGKYLYLPGVSIKSAAPPKSGAVPFDVLSIASEMEAACPHYAGPDVDYSVDASKVHTWAQALRATQPATSGQTLAGAGGDAMESWHSAMNDAGELFSNASDDRFASRASRVLAWIKANRPATSAGTTGDDSEDAARYRIARRFLSAHMVESNITYHDEVRHADYLAKVDAAIDARRAREVGNG